MLVEKLNDNAGAKLNSQQQTLIINWAAKTKDSIEVKN